VVIILLLSGAYQLLGRPDVGEGRRGLAATPGGSRRQCFGPWAPTDGRDWTAISGLWPVWNGPRGADPPEPMSPLSCRRARRYHRQPIGRPILYPSETVLTTAVSAGRAVADVPWAKRPETSQTLNRPDRLVAPYSNNW